jgi:aryl-alcohol dehydrogenase-like predicted oxidoreductase
MRGSSTRSATGKRRRSKQLNEYRTWCEEHSLDPVTTAVKWVTQQPGITSAIIGASRPEQLEASHANMSDCGGRLPFPRTAGLTVVAGA